LQAQGEGMISKALVSGYMEKYVDSDTHLVVCKKLSSNLKDFIDEGEKLCAVILQENQLNQEQKQWMGELNEELATLIASKPQPHATNLGRSVFVDSGLVSSVKQILHDVNFENLEQTIKYLNYELERWFKKLASTTSGKVSRDQRMLRAANQKYLGQIKGYAQRLTELHLEYTKSQSEITRIKEKALADFQIYERQKVPIIKRFLSADENVILNIDDQRFFNTNAKLLYNKSLILILKVGSRELYFDLTEKGENDQIYLF
jgi:hypothetical protein